MPGRKIEAPLIAESLWTWTTSQPCRSANLRETRTWSSIEAALWWSVLYRA